MGFVPLHTSHVSQSMFSLIIGLGMKGKYRDEKPLYLKKKFKNIEMEILKNVACWVLFIALKLIAWVLIIVGLFFVLMYFVKYMEGLTALIVFTTGIYCIACFILCLVANELINELFNID